MATYDIEQQEQLDQVKQFWKQYGNLITWILIVLVGGFAAWNGYNLWQANRAAKAGGLFEELDKAASAGDVQKVGQSFVDLKSRYAGTTFAEQGALLAAKVQADHQAADQSKAALQWLVENGKNADLVAIGRLRLAGLQMDAKQFDEALKTLSVDFPEEFVGLAQDRRGDVLSAQGKKADALAAYQKAWKALDASVDYRRFVEGKLTALGHAPVAPEAAASAAQ